MAKSDNAKVWAELWKTSVKKPDKEADRMQAVRWNQRSDHFGKHREEDKGRQQKKVADVLAILKDAGFKPKGATVLDIGCGPGALSVPLAKAGAKVTAFDIASGMLDRLKETVKDEKLDITTIEGSWYTADIDKLKFRKKFDLVLASMTPAVRDLETFDRMMACSKKYCYYSNFIKRDMGGKAHMEIHKILCETTGAKECAPVSHEHLHGQKDHDHGPAGHEKGPGPGLVYPFMYLYTLGYQPVIRMSHVKRVNERDWEEAADRTIEGLEKKKPLSDDTKKKLRDYYKSASKGGKFRSESETYSGMMVWKLKN